MKNALNPEFADGKFGLHGMIPKFTREKLKNLLIAFCDQSQDVLALGIIEKFRSKCGEIKVRTPLKSMKPVDNIQFGTLAIKTTGEQIN